MTTREEAFTAVRKLNDLIATLKCAGSINSAKYSHEIDNGYSKLATAADVIAPLAYHLHWLRHEARAVCIPQGTYLWAVETCAKAESIALTIKNIEMRI